MDKEPNKLQKPEGSNPKSEGIHNKQKTKNHKFPGPKSEAKCNDKQYNSPPPSGHCFDLLAVFRSV